MFGICGPLRDFRKDHNAGKAGGAAAGTPARQANGLGPVSGSPHETQIWHLPALWGKDCGGRAVCGWAVRGKAVSGVGCEGAVWRELCGGRTQQRDDGASQLSVLPAALALKPDNSISPTGPWTFSQGCPSPGAQGLSVSEHVCARALSDKAWVRQPPSASPGAFFSFFFAWLSQLTA